MMYTVSYVYVQLGKAIPVKHIGATVAPAERTVIKFAQLDDAFEAARAVLSAGAQTAFVSDTEDTERRYMIPKAKPVLRCRHGKEIDVHKSAAGWYIGVVDDCGPFCRISGYYRSKEEAQHHLDNRTFYRDAIEIDACNRRHGCIPEDVE